MLTNRQTSICQLHVKLVKWWWEYIELRNVKLQNNKMRITVVKSTMGDREKSPSEGWPRELILQLIHFGSIVIGSHIRERLTVREKREKKKTTTWHNGAGICPREEAEDLPYLVAPPLLLPHRSPTRIMYVRRGRESDQSAHDIERVSRKDDWRNGKQAREMARDYP